MIAFLTAGGALTNLLLASRVFGGDDNDAAANGVVFFGGWAVLTYLAKQAGTMTAANTNLLILWNAASAALCLQAAPLGLPEEKSTTYCQKHISTACDSVRRVTRWTTPPHHARMPESGVETKSIECRN